MPTCWINTTPKCCSQNTSQILIINLTIKSEHRSHLHSWPRVYFLPKRQWLNIMLCCPTERTYVTSSFKISTHVPTQVHWWMSIMFTQSAQWWKYLLCLKTLQRPAFLVACWVQTGQFQIWPVPTSQGYKSTMLSLIEMNFEMKIISDIAEFQESQVVL